MNQENNTFFVGKVLHNFEELASTNLYATDLVSKSNPSEGTVISTGFQTAGRGQMGSTWQSAAGQNITLSIILYPKFVLATQQFLLNQVISLGVYDCLSAFVSQGLSIKWSNDLYVSHNKIGGILIQNSLKGSSIQTSIVGIGLNINQTFFTKDAPNPTSLALETGQNHDLEQIRQGLFSHIEQWYLRLRAGHFEQIKAAYLDHLYLFGKKSFFLQADGTRFEGEIIGISPIGKLQIQTKEGKKSFGFKEIKFLLP